MMQTNYRFSLTKIGHIIDVADSITEQRCTKYGHDGHHFADDISSTF